MRPQDLEPSPAAVAANRSTKSLMGNKSHNQNTGIEAYPFQDKLIRLEEAGTMQSPSVPTM